MGPQPEHDLYWLNYCLCCGLGCGSCDKPLCGHISLTGCCNAVCCELKSPVDPACYQPLQCLCLQGISCIPPKDVQCCIICGLKPCGGEVKMTDPPGDRLTHTGKNVQLSYGRWLCWSCCSGCHYSEGCLGEDFRPHCEIKHLCCHHECFFYDQGRGFLQCMAMKTCCCCWTHYHCPRPEKAPPCCVCFNVTLPPSRAKVGTET